MADKLNVDSIPESERWFSVLLGGMLILSSLRRREPGTGSLFALAGSALVFRGIVGHDGFFAALWRLLRGDVYPVAPGDGAADPALYGDGE